MDFTKMVKLVTILRAGSLPTSAASSTIAGSGKNSGKRKRLATLELRADGLCRAGLRTGGKSPAGTPLAIQRGNRWLPKIPLNRSTQMDESSELDSDRKRRTGTSTSRLRSPRTRATQRRKTKISGGAFGGRHQRRNKHWSW
jgi:hypothetical protein